MKKIFPLILCALLLLFPGCAKENVLPQITGPKGDSFAGLTVYLSETVLYDEMKQSQKLSDPNTPEGAYFLARLNQIVKRMGFKITFETIPNLWPQATPDRDGVSYTYINSCLDYAAKLRGGDAAILFSPYKDTSGLYAALTQTAQPFIRQIDAQIWRQFAPNWYACNRSYIENDASLIPTGYYRGVAQNPVLLVRDDIARAYDGAIHTLEDYEAFLNWCKAEYPDLTPSLILDQLTARGPDTGYRDELLNLFSGASEGFPADTMFFQHIGFTLIEEQGETLFRPAEQDPNFAQCVKTLLSWRDEGLVELYNLAEDTKSSFDPYASALVSGYYWQEGNLDYIAKHFPSTLLPFMQQAPYILFSGQMPEYVAQYSPLPAGISCLGVNASDKAAAEWLCFLEWLHANNMNLRKVIWGAEGVEYQIQDEEYAPLPYPKPEDLENPFDYDFRYDFRALQYFRDDRYPSVYTSSLLYIPTVKSVNTGRIQNALDALIIPDVDSFITDPEVVSSVPTTVILRREEALRAFLRDLIKLPSESAEAYIEAFAKAQQKDCRTLSAYYSHLYKRQADEP